MLVAVTGGTGFVGSHTVDELLRAGHRVRMLVRDEAAVERALRPLEAEPGDVEVVVTDVTDQAGIEKGVRGADGVLHAASVFSFDSRAGRTMRAVNAAGTEIVLDAARAAGVRRVVYVSSVVALMPSRRRPLDADSPVGTPREAYAASKAAAERIARRHQAAGAPVAIVYPPALLGPNDPHLGDLTMLVRNVLRGRMPIWPTGGFPVGDVRDTAALHTSLFSPGVPDRGRYFGPGTYLRTQDFLQTLRAVTGRALPAVHLPAAGVLPVGLLAGLLQRVLPVRLPVAYGAIYTAFCATRVDEGAAAPLGITPRPAGDTMADTVRWLHREGLLSDQEAGMPAVDRSLSAT